MSSVMPVEAVDPEAELTKSIAKFMDAMRTEGAVVIVADAARVRELACLKGAELAEQVAGLVFHNQSLQEQLAGCSKANENFATELRRIKARRKPGAKLARTLRKGG